MIRRCYFLTLLVVFASFSLWAVAQPAADDDANRRRLEELRQHPEELARLRETLQQFQNLPEARREALVQLDRDLRDLPKTDRDRLSNVLSRYADWLDQLRQRDPKTSDAIRNAPDAASRLALIKNERDRQWISTQPRATRERWQKLNADERAALVLQLRQEQRDKHERWILTGRFWSEVHAKKPLLPARLADLSVNVKDYVEHYLMPRLTDAEKQRLSKSEGRWPDYPRALVEIASKRPPALPPARREDWPRKIADLPTPVQQRLTEKKGAGDKKAALKAKTLKELRNFEGPNFASLMVAAALRDGKMPLGHEYLACNYKSLMPAMKEFVDKDLMPVIDDAARSKFVESEGKWPDYPLTIQELSAKHGLTPPWQYLPDSKTWKWDLYRNLRGRSAGKGGIVQDGVR